MKIFLSLISIISTFSIVNAQDLISIEFDNDSVSFGTLNLAEYNALDETLSPETASFTISDITGPDLIVSLNATGKNINLLGGGLADGSAGFNDSGEGFTLSFSRSVTLVSFDWNAFSDSDEGALSFTMAGVDPISVSESDASWLSATTDIQSIDLVLDPTDSVTLSYTQGSFLLQGLTLETATIVPEPSFYAGALGLVVLITTLIKRKRKN